MLIGNYPRVSSSVLRRRCVTRACAKISSVAVMNFLAARRIYVSSAVIMLLYIVKLLVFPIARLERLAQKVIREIKVFLASQDP